MKGMSIIVAAAVLLVAGAAVAHDYKVGSIEIDHPWVRATPKGARVGGGYLAMKNVGPTADRLVGASVAFARQVQIHSMTMDQGVMKMRELKDGLEIKPGETVELKPGGYHLMFVDLKKPLVQGQRVKATLSFEKAGAIDVEYTVEAIGAGASQGAHGMGH